MAIQLVLERGLVTESALKYLRPNISEITAAGYCLNPKYTLILARENKREGTKGIKTHPKELLVQARQSGTELMESMRMS